MNIAKFGGVRKPLVATHSGLSYTDAKIPCASEPVRLAQKEMGQKTSARQRQALALGWKEIKEFVGSVGEGLRANRERALLCVAYDTMARRTELVAINVEDVEYRPNGSGTVLIRRSKTEGTGSIAPPQYARAQSSPHGAESSPEIPNTN